MEKKYYIVPEVAKNEIYTLSNLALDVIISNGTIVGDDEIATKQRKDDSEKHDNNTDWGNIW